MYYPKCGELLQESRGSFTCLRGDMELSRNMADRLYSCFVAKTEEPEEAVPVSELLPFADVAGYSFELLTVYLAGSMYCDGWLTFPESGFSETDPAPLRLMGAFEFSR